MRRCDDGAVGRTFNCTERRSFPEMKTLDEGYVRVGRESCTGAMGGHVLIVSAKGM